MTCKFIALVLMLLYVVSHTNDANGGDSSRRRRRAVIQELNDVGGWRELIETNKNVLVYFGNGKKTLFPSKEIIETLQEAADLVRSFGAIAVTDCLGVGKLLCKEVGASPATDQYVLKHYFNGEFNRDYDRAFSLSSIVNFMKDPTGDVPWVEDNTSKDLNNVEDQSKENITSELISEVLETPECNITQKEAISAFQRAQTQLCKQQISAIACKNFNDSLYPHELPQFCVNNVSDSKSDVVTFEQFENHPESDNSVQIVFLLTLNGRAYRQVIRLIKNLFHKRHFFYIHVDARQDYLYRELLILNRKLPHNVRFVSNRRATIWGGASLLTVLLSSMEDLVINAHKWNWNWDYVINLSESDFPLKTIQQLEKFLTINRGKNFIKSHGRDVQKFIQKQGLDKTFFECENRMWRLGDRKLPQGIVIDGGSDWVALHRKFVQYIISSNDTLVNGLKTVYKYTLLPAESFFHTVLQNSAFCDTFVDNNLHVTNWKRKLGCKCQYRNVVDWCGCSPNDFRLLDWSRLQSTEKRFIFFGRKFECVVSQAVVNNLESWLYPNHFQAHSITSDRFWQNIYHHHDLSPKRDDAVMTLAFSLGRQALNTQKSMWSDVCSHRTFMQLLSFEELLINEAELIHHELEVTEMNIFLHHDAIQGILVRFIGYIANVHVESEAWFKFKPLNVEYSETGSSFENRIRQLQIGLDYDQKEQIFRHFSKAIGPDTEPTLSYNCITEETFNVTFIWVNPDQSVEAEINITIPIGSTSNFVKPTLSTPLLPGLWTVRVVAQDGILLSQVDFLILPLQFVNGKKIPSFKQKFVASNGKKEGNPKSEPSSLELVELIDSLTSRAYELEDLCVVDAPSTITLKGGRFSSCIRKEWSSLYPDPKSTIGGVDELSGTLVP